MNHYYLEARIDASAISHNCLLLKKIAGGMKICPAVKANAYGHDIKIVLQAMDDIKADMLAVASITEAVELRDLGWKAPILIFGSEFSIYSQSHQEKLANWLISNEVRITITRSQDLLTLIREADKLKKEAIVHTMFDSGMSRMGLDEAAVFEIIELAQRSPQVKLEGLYTHLATADEADKTFAKTQLANFEMICEKLKREDINIPLIHAANSGATIDLPQAHLNMIRPGISIYGYHSGDEMHNKPDLKPSLKLISYLTLVKQIPANSFVGYGKTFTTTRQTTIGLVPIGYADGFPRELSNKGKMIIADHVVPIIGRISMDQTIVDLTDLTLAGLNPKAGDEIIIYDNKRESPNSIESTAKLLNTIPYCLTTALGNRVHRIAASW